VGISGYKTRYAAVILSGILAALGGAYLSIGFVGSFGENMTAGRGFIALAAVIFGNWRPFGAYAAAVLFGASTALSFRLATYSDSAALLFARGARGRIRRTLERAGGLGRVRLGRVLGVAGISVALSASIAVGFYELLLRLEG